VGLLSNILQFSPARSVDAIGAAHPSRGWRPDPVEVESVRPQFRVIGSCVTDHDSDVETVASDRSPFETPRSIRAVVSDDDTDPDPDPDPDPDDFGDFCA
jgi:hypothetical protein